MARLCLLAAIVLVARGQLECALTKRPAKEVRGTPQPGRGRGRHGAVVSSSAGRLGA